ncbi:hypothetical protein [Rhizobium sp. CNPSo 3490]|uniref:hypothetical protein n=1 Tax=Rhizobium sp. CNPSo 3490 TaxID=3021407 RepID=UPI0025503448|nr:hypothetical protein [Rhizobium sp. CNPSo 3490]MDK4735840.1 hypothetical protein [Rhizobium sp. CNPSo 3490]
MKRADGPVGGKAEYAGVIETDFGGGRSVPVCNDAFDLWTDSFSGRRSYPLIFLRVFW